MESETYTEVTSDAGEMFFVKVLSDAWHVFAGEAAIGSDGANSCHRRGIGVWRRRRRRP